jgi:hypothetical protein
MMTQDNAWFFHEKEYIALRAELLALAKDMRFFERAAIAGPVAVYVWLVAQQPSFREQPLFLVAWWAPVLLIAFLLWRYWEARREIILTAKYVMKVESQYALPCLKGWETHYAAIVGTRPLVLPLAD